MKKALENTIATFTAFEGETAVGMVRLIGDGGMSFYIKDFTVVPEYQSKCVGTMLLKTLEHYILFLLGKQPSIREVVLDEIVLEEINKALCYVRNNTKEFTDYISKKTSSQYRKELNAKTAELSEAEKRIVELKSLFKRLYNA